MQTPHSHPPDLVKMSVLARLSGVPAATIKHYLREGLLPEPAVKTGRNMAFYDAALVERIKRIKALQREHFLPLRLIKSVLEGRPSNRDDAEAAAAIERALDATVSSESRTRAQLVASGMTERELRFFESLGLVTATRVDGQDTFRGDDLALLRVLGASRRAGISADMLPAQILGRYVQAIGELARVELEMFRHGVVARAGGDVAKLTEAATHLSERLVVLIRRKLLLPTLHELIEEHGAPARGASRAKRKRTKPRPRRPRG